MRRYLSSANRRKGARVGVLAFAALLLWQLAVTAGPAHAATTVSNPSGTLEIAAPGFQANVVSIAASPGQILVTDRGDKVTAGTGCQLVSLSTVSCPSGGVAKIEVSVGDRDDQVTNSTWVRADLSGGAGNDTLTGGTGEDRLIGGLGADILNGGGGDRDRADYSDRKAAVTVSLSDGLANDGEVGEGDNVNWDIDGVTGGSGSDVLRGTAGADNLYGGAGRDALDGYGGDDILSGGEGDDTHNGGDGDDTFYSEDFADGADSFNGGAGDDHVSYHRRHSVVVDIDGVADDGWGFGESDNVKTNVERVTGGWNNDTLTGSAGADHLNGGRGDDTLNGLAGDDTLLGAADDDVLNGGDGQDTFVIGYGVGADGADVFNGGGGSLDNLSYAERAEAVVIDLDAVADDGALGESDNVKADVEHVTGGSGNDSLTGSASTNHLFGGGGDDDLEGLGGDDRLYGEAGSDSLGGGAGDDRLYGGTGNDSLDDGTGDDRLYGGTGNDELNGFDRVQHNDLLDGEANFDSCASDRLDSQTSCEDSSQSGL